MEQRHINNLKRFADEVRKSVEQTQPPPAPNRKITDALEAFGRERLSAHYFMRDFLYSEIAAVHGIPNVPDHPELAIEAGKGLCDQLLEPLREIFGHITIRSAFRSTTVNGYGNKHHLNCARNERNFARHIWDYRDADDYMGATACVVVPWFLEYPGYRENGDWRPLAWFIHDKLPYSEMEFYPLNAAFNLTWREREPRRVVSMCSGWTCHAARLGDGYGSRTLTKPGFDNHGGDHGEHYHQICLALEQTGRTERATGPKGRITNIPNDAAIPEPDAPHEQKASDETVIDHDSGLEPEREDSSAIRQPFDPEKIRIRTVNPVISQIVSRIEHGEIDLAPGFQRMAGIWNVVRKSRLIESLLLRIPIPVFYVAADKDETWAVVDGLQRISTIHDHVAGSFRLTGLEYLNKLDGCLYTDLPRPMQRRISETQLVVNVIEPGTPEEVMFNIFRRINTGGMMLNGQEIRHALHPGPIRDYLKKLAETSEFLEATDRSIRTKRMADRECVLRFLAFHVNPWEGYSVNDLDGHLGRTMKQINAMDSRERDRISGDFEKSMKAAFRIFRKDAFRKRHDPTEKRRPVSKALFEAWSVGLARRSDQEIDALVKKREKVVSQFASLMNQDQEFDTAISYSTGIPARIRKRFRAIEELIEECL